MVLAYLCLSLADDPFRLLHSCVFGDDSIVRYYSIAKCSSCKAPNSHVHLFHAMDYMCGSRVLG